MSDIGHFSFSDGSLVLFLCLFTLNKWFGRLLSCRVHGSNLLSYVDSTSSILLLRSIFGCVDNCFGFNCLILLYLLSGIFDSGCSHIFLLLLLWHRLFWLLSCLDWFHVKFLKLYFLTKALLLSSFCLIFLSNCGILCIVLSQSHILGDVLSLRYRVIVSNIRYNTDILISHWSLGLRHISRRDSRGVFNFLSCSLFLNLVTILQRSHDVGFHNFLLLCSFLLVFISSLILKVFWVFHDIVILHLVIMISITDIVTIILIIIIFVSNLDSESNHYRKNGKKRGFHL